MNECMVKHTQVFGCNELKSKAYPLNLIKETGPVGIESLWSLQLNNKTNVFEIFKFL